MFKIHYARAFSSKKFQGNPAGVVLVEHFPSTAVMQNLAACIGISQISFIKPINISDYVIRWFSPKDETPLCGHATIASHQVLFEKYNCQAKRINFIHAQGIIQSNRTEDDRVILAFPIKIVEPIAIEGLYKEILGEYKCNELYSDGVVDVAVFQEEEDVLNFVPNFDLIKKIGKRAFNITAKGKDFDFVSRYFAPKVGIPEDPFCGSSLTRLGALWAAKLEKTELSCYQSSGKILNGLQSGGEANLIIKDKMILIGASSNIYGAEERT